MNILSCCLFAAFSATVGELPPSYYADTEVSTNVAVAVDATAMRQFSVVLSLVVSPTNSVEVSVGRDSDGDGNLSPEEADYAFGCDCGSWFCRDTRANASEPLPPVRPSATGRQERTFLLNRRQAVGSWNLAKVTRRGLGPVREFAAIKRTLQGFKLRIR